MALMWLFFCILSFIQPESSRMLAPLFQTFMLFAAMDGSCAPARFVI